MHGTMNVKFMNIKLIMISNRYFDHSDFSRTKNISILFSVLAISILEAFLFQIVVRGISDKSNPIRKEV